MNKHYVKTALGAILLTVSSTIFAQTVGINTTGSNPSTNAILDLNTGNTGNTGFLVPHVVLTSLTTFNPPIVGAYTANDAGILIYNTSSTIGNGVGFYFWNNTLGTPAWQYVGSSVSGTGIINYLARWTPTAAALGTGVSQDNGTVAVISTTAAVFGTTTELTANGNATQINAILGASITAGGIGVTGSNTATTGTSIGVQGFVGTVVAPTTVAGVYGSASAAGYGVQGALSGAGAGAAVEGVSTATGTSEMGVQGSATGAATKNIGGQFSATGGTTNYALIVPAASGNVGFGNIAPAGSAIVDFTNTNATGGTGLPILWPVNTNTANIASPVTGEEFYNSTLGCFQFYNGTTWELAGCPCSTSPPTPTITASCSGPFGGSAVTYSITASVGTNYDWTAFSSTGAPGTTANGLNTITVTWPSGATTGTVTATVSNLCGVAAASFSTAIHVDTLSGPDSLYSGCSNSTGHYHVSYTGGTYAWTVTPAGSATVAGAATQTATVSGATGSFTIQCIAAAVAGGCTVTLTQPVTVSSLASGNVVKQDQNVNSAGTNVYTVRRGNYQTNGQVTITTTNDNDFVICVMSGYNSRGTTPTNYTVTYTGAGAGNAAWYMDVFGHDAGNCYSPIEIFTFVAATAGTYTLTFNDPGSWGEWQNFAIALTGFCLPPTPANDIIDTAAYTAYGIYVAPGLSQDLPNYLLDPSTPGHNAMPIGTYAFVALCDKWGGSDGGGITFGCNYTGIYGGPTEENNGFPSFSSTTAAIFGWPNLPAYALNGFYIGGADVGYPNWPTMIGMAIH